MGKGMLLEKEGRFGIVLTPQGEFRRVPVDAGAQVGDEVSFPDASPKAVPGGSPLPWRRWTLVAVAAALLLLLVPIGWQEALPQAFAIITVDINPSVELTVTQRNRVLSARGLNEDGNELLLAVGGMRGRLSNEAVSLLTEQAIATGKLDPADMDSLVVVAVAPVRGALKEETSARLQSEAQQAAEVSLEAAAVRRGAERKAQVVSVAASAEQRERAKQDGLSVGKEVLLQNLQELSPTVTVEAVRSMPPARLVREVSAEVGVEIKLGELFGRGHQKEKDEKKGPGDSRPVSGPAGSGAGAESRPKPGDEQKGAGPGDKGQSGETGNGGKPDEKTEKGNGGKQNGSAGKEKQEKEKQEKEKQEKGSGAGGSPEKEKKEKEVGDDCLLNLPVIGKIGCKEKPPKGKN